MPSRETPKALANFSPGFERSENPGAALKNRFNPERVRCERDPFRVPNLITSLTQGCRFAPTLG